MPKRGATFGSEENAFVCRETGALVRQLTSASVHSHAFYFEQTSFTADNNTLIFVSQRTAGRGVPWDLFKVDVDGKNMVQISDEEHPFCAAIPSPDEERVLYTTRGNSLYALDVDTLDEREVCHCDEASVSGLGSITGDGKYFLSTGNDAKDGETLIIRFDIEAGEAVTMCRGSVMCHLNVDWGGTTLSFRGPQEEGYPYWLSDINGDNRRKFEWDNFAHNTWYGKTNKLQGTMLPPGHGIGIMALDDEEPEMVCQGPYFWHSGVSLDGEWIVADTNWPDVGLQLVHVPTGRFGTVVLSGSTNSASQESHPHPSFNRDATKVLYTSNRTGLAQVYLCDIPDELKKDLTTGEITNRLRFGA